MSRPRPRPAPYWRRMHENRLQLQANMARAYLRRHKWRIVAVQSCVGLVVLAAGGALALALERVFR